MAEENVVRLRTLSGEFIEVRFVDTWIDAAEIDADLDPDDLDMDVLGATAEVDLDTWERVVDEELFNLLPGIAPESAWEDFEPNAPIVLELGLRSALAERFDDSPNPEDALLAAVLESPDLGGLRQTEAWLLRRVVQPVELPGVLDDEGVELGFETRWANEDGMADEDLETPVTAFLAGADIEYDEVEPGVFRTTWASEADVPWVVIVAVHEEERLCAVLSIFPGKVPADRRADVALKLMEWNAHAQVGAFELDPDSGAIAFRTSVAVGDGELHRPHVEQLFRHNVATMGAWFEELEAFSDE